MYSGGPTFVWYTLVRAPTLVRLKSLVTTSSHDSAANTLSRDRSLFSAVPALKRVRHASTSLRTKEARLRTAGPQHMKQTSASPIILLYINLPCRAPVALITQSFPVLDPLYGSGPTLMRSPHYSGLPQSNVFPYISLSYRTALRCGTLYPI